MCLDYNKIRELVEESKYSKRQIVSNCGFTRPTLDGLLQGADVKVSTISAFAKFFNLPVSYFFNEDRNMDIRSAGKDYYENKDNVAGDEISKSYSTEKDNTSKEVAFLKKTIETLEKTIATLEAHIADKDIIIDLLKQSGQ